jgi:rSAM/selenodomain-associated transferase 1
VRRQLVVLARWPVPGRCKRRLAAGIGSNRAALVQQRLNRHTLASARALGAMSEKAIQPQVVLAADPLGPQGARRWARQLEAHRGVRQGPGGLGVRMQRQLQRALRAGAEQVVLIGSDLPELQPLDLLAAFRALEDSPLVLGPADDGGYWLIGLSRQAPERLAGHLFSGMPWGSAQVLELTLAAARQQGVEPALLGQRADLDRPADLRHWR